MQQATPLITNETALDEDIPPARDNIVAREDEFGTLELSLRPIERGQKVESLLVDGDKGTGKSHCVQIMLDELANEIGGFDYTTISCHETDTRVQILANAAAEVTEHGLPALRNKSGQQLRDLLRSNIDRPLMVVCDETDSLGDDALLALWDLYKTDHCAFAVIVNDAEGFLDTVRPSLAQRIQNSYRVEFSDYSVPDLVEILQVRAEYGLREDAVRERDLEAIAQRAQANGSARLAIVTLRMAANVAATAGREHIRSADIAAAAPDARQYIRSKDFDLLSDTQQTLVDVVQQAGREYVSCSEVRERYEARVDEPVSGGHRRRCLRKLRDYGFVEQRGTGKGSEYRYLPLDD